MFDNKLQHQSQRLQQALITASTIIQAYNLMNYDAVAIGRQDLAAGLTPLKNLAQEASFPFLSANIVDMNGAVIFEEIKYLQRSGMRIAIIGLTGQTQLPSSCINDLEILPWHDVLPNLVKRASAKSDLTILLSNLDAAANKEIANKFDNIHIILQSGVSKHNMKPQVVNNTLITQSGDEGKYQGQLTVNWSPSQKWQTTDQPLLTLRKEYDRLGWLIGRVEKKGGPAIVYKDNSAQQKDYAKKFSRYKELEIELKEMASNKKENVAASATYSNHFHPLPPSIPDDKSIEKLLFASRKKANQVRRKKSVTKKLSQYLGSDNCKKCHDQIFKAWAQTRHASAYKTLETRDQNNNLTCVFCHVTGLDENTAYLSASLPDQLKSVGCETCHGPGKEHAKDPQTFRLIRSPVPHICLSCHTPDRDDNFNYQVKKALVH